MIRVVKRSGRVEKLDISKIQKFTSKAVEGLKNVSQSELEIDAKLHFYDMIPTHEIQTALINTAVDKIDIDRPDWTFVASRLFLYDIYHKVSGFTGYMHLRDYFEKGEREGRILKGLKEKYDLDDLNDYIKPERDLQFTYLGIRTLYDRYLIKDRENNPIELPQHLFMGVAMFLAQNEFDCQSWAKKFYDILSKFEVMAATPTLSNARTTRHQLSSCFPKGERVFTYDGYKNIEDIKEGDFVLTHKNRFKRVYELLQRDYSRELFTFDIAGLESGTLKCTEEHPILTVKADEVECIRKGKLCIINQGNYKKCFKVEGEYRNDCELLNRDFSGVAKWVEAQNIKKGDFVQISFPTHTHKKEHILVSDFLELKGLEVVDGKILIKRESCGYEYYSRSFYNNQISPINNQIALDDDFMRLIGYYLAEGYTSSDLSSIHFTFGSKEKEFIQDCSSLLEKIFDVNILIKEKNDNSTVISVHSKILGEFIYALAGSGFDKKYLSETLFYAKNQKHILVGAFRGDSCTIENGMALSLSNHDLIKQLYTIALREGLTPKIREPKPSKLAKEKPYILEIHYLNDREFIELVGKDLHKIIVKENREDGTPVGRAINQFWFEDNFFAKVKDVNRKTINEKVYNLEVEDDHSYVVNSVAVHNCYIGSTPDNIEGIFDGYKEMALLSKFGGGIGWDWTKVRAMGSSISGHKRAAGGVVPFLKIANDVAIAVDQLGCVAKNSFVRVLDSVTTSRFTHNFRREYQEHNLDKDDVLEIIKRHIKNFVFKYGKFSKDEIYELLKDYVSGYSLTEICNKFDISRDQYKKIIGRFKKINKGLPEGFVTLEKCPNYAIHRAGVVINLDSLKSLGTIIDRKGYVRVAIGKKSIPLHKLLVETFLDTPKDEKYTIDHIDGNKLNNSLDNFELISNEDNISKGWQKSKAKRVEMSRVRKHLSLGFKLKGDKRDTPEVEIKDISVKTIPISEVRIGDLVESFNIELGKVQYRKVQAVHELEVKKENQIKISFDNGYIITSKWHPMAVKGKNGYFYKRSDELEVGELGVNHKGKTEKIIAIDNAPDISEEYMDLTVDGTNNYFASTDKSDNNFYLTHNTRKGAIAVYLEPWHMDVREFIELKKNSGEERRRAHDLFPALWINDIFMRRVEADEKWTLFDPYEVPELTELYGEEFERRYIELESDESVTKEVISAKALWKEVLRNYFETGNPFITFKDTANIANPNSHTGIIRSSNLCTEIFQNTSPNYYKIKVIFEDFSEATFDEEESVLLDNGIKKEAKLITALDSINGKKIWIVDKEEIDGETAVCNLASINLSKINSDEDIARVVPVAIRMLDNVIDLNFYPLAKVKKTNEANRAIGLGVMGEAQMLAEAKLEWGSSEHFHKVDEVMEAISYYAIKTSSDLAIEKGRYPHFEGSDWSRGVFPIDKANESASKLVDRGGVFGYKYDWEGLKAKVKSDGMRNGYLMAIAPTSSISILTGTTQAIEPIFKRKWYEKNLSGMIPVVAPNLSADTWGYYVSGYELDQRVLVRVAAIRQKWIDQGQSLNIFIALDRASGRYLNDIYMEAWKFGLKSTYYLRSQSPEEIKSTESIEDRSMECVGCQ